MNQPCINVAFCVKRQSRNYPRRAAQGQMYFCVLPSVREVTASNLPGCKCRCFASDDGHQKLSGVIQAVYVLYDRGSPFERTVDGEADMH